MTEDKPKFGTLEKLLGKFGFVRADRVEPEVEQGSDEDDAARLARVYKLPTPADRMPLVINLDLTDRQQLAFLSPYAPGMNPPAECMQTEKLKKGFAIVTWLLVTPHEKGEYLMWHALVSAFMVLKKGKAPIKPKGPMKGVMISRVQNLLKGVGEVTTDDSEWRTKGKQFVLGRRLTVREEDEFKRIHGQKWLSDAMRNMQKGGVTEWDVEE